MRHRLILLVITALGILGLIVVDSNYRLTVYDDNIQYLTLVTARTQDQLTANIQSSVDALESLKAFMLSMPDLPDYATFDRYTSQLFDVDTDIRTFQYVDTDRIIRHMYPLEGNEVALNLDLTTNPVAPTVERAIRERITNVNNPFVTVQGSLSIVARSPLYRGEEFMGLVQVVVDIETLIENVFETIPNEFDVQLSDATGRIFWGSEINDSNVQLAIIPVADSTWTLSVCWRDAPAPSPIVMGIIWGGGSILLLILLFSVNQSLQRMINLRKEVDARTASLTEKNAELLAEITEREHVEEALAKTQEREYMAIKAANVGLWNWNLVNNTVHFSHEWKKQIGYEDHEITNNFSEWESRLHPLDRETALQTVQKYIAKPYSNYKDEFRVRHKDGTYRWILAQGYLLCDDQGKPNRMLGAQIDITERKQAEEELRISEKLFSNVFNVSPAGMIITRIVDGKFIDVNEFFCKMLGFNKDEVMGNTLTELNMWSPEERKRLVVQLTKSGGLLQNFESVARAKSGRLINVLFSSKEIDIRGEPCYLATLIDITSRKLAEEALRASEKRFSQFFAVSPVATTVTRIADSQFIDVNVTAEKLFGYSRDELLGKTSVELNLFVDPLEREGLAERSADSSSYKDVDIQLRSKAGDILDVVVSSDMIEINDETYAITMAHDVTERKRAQAELQRHLRDEQLLYLIGMELHDLQDTQTLIQRIVNILDNILQYPYTAVLLIDQESGELFPFALSDQGQGDQFIEIDKAYISSKGVRLGKGITGWVAQTGQSIRTGNVTENEHYLGLRTDIQSELCLPLIIDNQVIGVFNTESDQQDAYDAYDQAFLEIVVAQIAVAIRNTRLSETLRESEERLRNLFENASDAIFVSNSDGYYTDVNTRACKMFGYTREEFIGKHLSELVASDNLISQPLRVDLLITGKTLISERMLKAKDGRLVPVEISGTQLPDGTLMGMVRDITERKQAEQLLQKYNQRLKILRQIDKNIIIGGSSEKIVESVLEILRQLIDCERATVVLFDEQTEEVIVLGTTNGINSVVQKGVSVSVKGDPHIEFFQEGKSLLVQDTANMETPASDIWDNLVNEGIRSFLVTPLIIHGRTIGSLHLLSKTANFFTSEQQEIITEIANQLTIGLYQVNLHEELAENEQRFRLLAENAVDIIFHFRLQPERGFQYISSSVTGITGYTPEEFYADADLSFKMVHPDDLRLLGQIEDREDINVPLIYRWVRKDGKIIWAEQRNIPVYDDNGTLIAFEGIARDITERKHTLEALKSSEMSEREQRQFAEALRDSAAALTTAVDLDSVMNTILKSVSLVVPNDAANIMLIENDHARQIYWAGYQPEQIEYLRDISFSISDTSNLNQMFITKLPILISDINQYPDWVHIPLMEAARSYVAAPIRSHGQVIGFLNLDSGTAGFYTEIHAQQLQSFADQASLAIEHAQLYETIQNHAQELEQRVEKRTSELQRSENRYQSIIEDQTDWVCRYVSGGILTFVNQTFAEHFNRSAESLLGKSRFELVSPDERPKLEDHIASLSLDNPSATIEIRYGTADGQTRWLLWSDRMLFNDEGNFLEYQSVGRDITERKIAEDQLQQMMDHAMNLSELRSRYVAMAAHDLRNPLAVIQSSVSIIQHYSDRLTDERIQAKYDQIARSIKGMVVMLDDVLTLGQADAGKLEFAPTSVDVKALCEDIIEEVIQYTNTAQQIEISSQGNCSNVYLDITLVRHILSNLFSNAIKYSPDVSVIIFDLNCSSNQIIFRVQDHGIGIPTADQNRLFETFHRASNAKSIAGTGLGLAIVKQSVESHGGTINFDSQENVGTTFIVTLPHNPQQG